MLARVAEPIEFGEISVAVSASLGFTLFPNDDADADTLLRHADQAMYVAKQTGKNRYHLFVEERFPKD
jgi:diguanylate cyclase (GGDEF)-like protein